MKQNPKKICKSESCDRQAQTAGFCPKHYQQIKKYGRLTPEREYQPQLNATCKVEDCGHIPIAKGYCYRHYQQIRRHGRLTPERERIYGRTHCQVPGCENRHTARGYCRCHYQLNMRKEKRLGSGGTNRCNDMQQL